MAKEIKKTKKSSVRTKSKSVMEMPEPSMSAMESAPSMEMTSARKMPGLNPKALRLALFVVLIALLTYKFGPWLFPARVGYMPISRFQIWAKMEKSYGAQTLDDLVNEKVLDAALAKQNVTVDQTKVDDQLKSLETQFQSVGGLDEALKQRGLTREELKKQIVTQLSVEQILKDKIEPSEAEVKADFDTNSKTMYKDKKFDDVKAEITSRLRDAKLREEFLTWFADVKKDIKVNNFGL